MFNLKLAIKRNCVAIDYESGVSPISIDIDNKFLLSGHSDLPNHVDFGIIEVALRKKNFLYTPQDY